MAHPDLPGGVGRPFELRSVALAGLGPRAASESPLWADPKTTILRFQPGSTSPRGSLPIKHGGFPVKHGHVPIKHGCSPINHGRVPNKHGRFPIKPGANLGFSLTADYEVRVQNRAHFVIAQLVDSGATPC